jgi:putative phosphoesterase
MAGEHAERGDEEDDRERGAFPNDSLTARAHRGRRYDSRVSPLYRSARIRTMLVGLISDTHGLLRAEVADAFAGVEHILHAGDVGSLDVLGGLARLAPVTAVRGNVDTGLDLPDVAHLELAGVRVLVVHGDRLDSRAPERVAAAHPGVDLVVFGHSHRPLVRRVGDVLAVNPGSAGRRRFRDPVSVALAELHDGEAIAALVML